MSCRVSAACGKPWLLLVKYHSFCHFSLFSKRFRMKMPRDGCGFSCISSELFYSYLTRILCRTAYILTYDIMQITVLKFNSDIFLQKLYKNVQLFGGKRVIVKGYFTKNTEPATRIIIISHPYPLPRGI